MEVAALGKKFVVGCESDGLSRQLAVPSQSNNSLCRGRSTADLLRSSCQARLGALASFWIRNGLPGQEEIRS